MIRGMMMLGSGLLLLGPLLFTAVAGADGAEIDQAMDETLRSGKFDLSVVQAIQRLKGEEQVRMAGKLAESPHPAMRRQAILILQNFPPEVAAESFRKLLEDKNRGNQNWAAQYLAERTNDPQALAILLRNASDKDSAVAARALDVLSRQRGADASKVLLKLLQEKGTPKLARLAAIEAAGNARAIECTPALIRLLDSRERRSTKPRDRVRICDLAASALERIHRINHTGVRNVYFTGSVEDRDAGIALWKEWHAAHGPEPMRRWREIYLGELLEQALKQSLEPSEDWPVLKSRLAEGMGTTFCLGDFPAISALVTPSVKDLWRILRVTPEKGRESFLTPWQILDREYRSGFLPRTKTFPERERSAQEFILFADGLTSFPELEIWSLCRNFAKAFPGSVHLQPVDEVRSRLEEEFRRDRKKVVLHGHLPVLEPIPEPVPLPDADEVISYGNALGRRVRQEPSQWAHHRLMVEYYRQRNRADEAYPLLDLLWRYPGNEWPFLADAIYQARHKKKVDAGLVSADKALILNPGNAKAYAVRGMIRLASGKGKDEALDDLRRAFALDPRSLDGEPETLDAAAFLIEQMLAADGRAEAKEAWRVLGELKAFQAPKPLKDTERFGRIMLETP